MKLQGRGLDRCPLAELEEDMQAVVRGLPRMCEARFDRTAVRRPRWVTDLRRGQSARWKGMRAFLEARKGKEREGSFGSPPGCVG